MKMLKISQAVSCNSPAPGTPGEGWGGGCVGKCQSKSCCFGGTPSLALPRHTEGGNKKRRAISRCCGIVGFATVAMVAAISVAGDEDSKPAYLQSAEQIASQIAPANNEYAHKECFIKWKGVDGNAQYANRTDCSDFLNLLLEHDYGLTPTKLHKLTGHQRPTATVWFDSVGSEKASALLSPVASISDLRAGDLILVKYQPGEADTGHVMIVDAAPARHMESEPAVPGTKQWAVTVIDSSKSGHGPNDTRHQPDNTFARGVGRGVFRLYTKPDGSVAGYAWSLVKKSKFVSVDEHAVRLARITPPK